MWILQSLITSAESQDREFSVALIDVDRFRALNDRQGYLAGDEVLWNIGKLLELSFTQRNPVCRFGADEFLVLFPDAPTAYVVSLAERAKREVSRNSGTPSINQSGQVTITIGLAFFPRHGHAPEVLLKSADVALHNGKQMGGNHVVSA